MLAGQRVGAGERVAHQVVDGDPGGAEGERPCVDAGEFEEVADHVVHPLHLGAYLPQVARRVDRHAVLQRLGHGPQSGERGAQVVRDPGDEFTPRGLQRALPCA